MATPHTPIPVSSPQPLRAFGAGPDLDLDFSSDDRPALVTALLSRCAPLRDASGWWASSVGERTAALLRVLACTQGHDDLVLTARCMAQGCGAGFEFALPLAGLADQGGGEAVFEVGLPDGRRLRLRRPTGEDLRAWRQATTGDSAQESVGDRLLASLLLRGELQPQDVPLLTEALNTHDPLVDFSVACTCPACGRGHELALDLEDVVLRRLQGRQLALLREVHAFARGYGWSEAQTLAVPPQRRAVYRALMESST